MFDQSMDASMMDESNASMDLGNLSTIFGSSKKPGEYRPNDKIEEVPEDEEDG